MGAASAVRYLLLTSAFVGTRPHRSKVPHVRSLTRATVGPTTSGHERNLDVRVARGTNECTKKLDGCQWSLVARLRALTLTPPLTTATTVPFFSLCQVVSPSTVLGSTFSSGVAEPIAHRLGNQACKEGCPVASVTNCRASPISNTAHNLA